MHLIFTRERFRIGKLSNFRPSTWLWPVEWGDSNAPRFYTTWASMRNAPNPILSKLNAFFIKLSLLLRLMYGECGSGLVNKGCLSSALLVAVAAENDNNTFTRNQSRVSHSFLSLIVHRCYCCSHCCFCCWCCCFTNGITLYVIRITRTLINKI